MRLEKVRARHLGPFKDFTLDLTKLGPEQRIIAITGENGVGKSTILELGLPGALYRQTPTRGSLVDLATARDSLLEAELVNGSRWTFRHLIDKVSGKSEAVVLDESGASVLPDSKVRSFDAWAAAHMPAPEVLFACMFSPQGAAGFLGAKPGERKATLLRVLGVERLEGFADRAREHERAARGALSTVLARLEDERERCGDAEATRAEVASAEETAARTEGALEAARASLALAVADQRKLDEHLRAGTEQHQKRIALKGRVQAASTLLADLEGRVQNNRAVLGEAPAIRAAVVERQRLFEQAAAIAADIAMIEGEARANANLALEAEGRLRALAVRIERAEEALSTRAAVEKAVASIPELEAAAAEAASALGVVETALEDLRAQRVAGSDDRILDLRGGLQGIVDTSGKDAVLRATSTLTADNAQERAARDYPAELELAQQALRAARECKAAADGALTHARDLASRATVIESVSEDLGLALSERTEIQARRATAGEAEKQKVESARQLRERAAAITAEAKGHEELARKAEPLAKAEARLAELEPQVTATAVERDRAAEELERTPEWPPAWKAPDVAGARAAAEEAERRAISERAGVARAAERLRIAEASSGRLAELKLDGARLEAELADWSRLSADLGRDGLQAAEIDAAGPELTELTSDLLHNCYGPRFTVRVDTQRLSADGKRMLEGCDVVVLDTTGGREASGETFSGGERVIIGEALSLSLSMLACQRAGLEGVTLVRDESGAALSAGVAPIYVPMLRRAVQLLGSRVDKVLFVSHSPAVVEMADARIEVSP